MVVQMLAYRDPVYVDFQRRIDFAASTLMAITMADPSVSLLSRYDAPNKLLNAVLDTHAGSPAVLMFTTLRAQHRAQWLASLKRARAHVWAAAKATYGVSHPRVRKQQVALDCVLPFQLGGWMGSGSGAGVGPARAMRPPQPFCTLVDFAFMP
jgi:hypothetical protein